MFRNSKRGVICIIIFLASIFLIPLIIDWLIIGNNVQSNISNSDWAGFLGGYIGALIGAITSLIGIIITIRYTNEQNKKDRELQIRPYCAIRYVPTGKVVGTQKILGNFTLGCEPKENNGSTQRSVIYIKNIGLGPAIDFDFDANDIDDGRNHYPLLVQKTLDTMNYAVDLLQPGEEGALPIMIEFNFDPISDADIIKIENDELNVPMVKHEVMTKYKNFDIVITVKYQDIFQNKYTQKITLTSNMHLTITEGKKATHSCDINLKEFTTPIQANTGK